MNRPSMTIARFLRLTQKELREILRDRRTIITLVLMPLLVYPMLSLVIQRFLPSIRGGDKVQYRFVFETPESWEQFTRGFLRSADNPDFADVLREADAMTASHFWSVNEGEESLEDLVKSGQVDVAVTKELSEEGEEYWQLLHRKSSQTSVDAVNYLQLRCQAATILAAPPSTELLFRTRLRSLKSKPGNAISLATLVPLMLVLMTITGGVYPAIDLTAGERERGTLETLVAAPVPRMAILLGKFIAVITVTLLTALVNMVGMMITIWSFQLDKFLFGTEGLSWTMVGQVFVLLVIFSGFFSAVLLAVTCFARSFKEAQAYLIPLMLISLTPGLLSLMPDLKLDGAMVILPLINIVLLARDIFQGNFDWSIALVVIFSTIIYGFLAISFAARIFGTDAILFENQTGLASMFKRPREKMETATLPGSLLCLALLFPANFMWIGLMGRLGETISFQQRLLIMAGGLFLLFAALPLVFGAIKRIKLPSGFGFRFGSLFGYVGAILLGISLGLIVIQIFATTHYVSEFFSPPDGNSELKDQMLKLAEQQVAGMMSIPYWQLLLCMAIVPALCEEVFFRGLLLRSMLKHTTVWVAILFSGILFGIFHILSANVLSLDRLLPTSLMGIVLGWVAYRSRSVFPGMILHAIHNAIYVSLAIFKDDLVAQKWITEDQQGLPTVILIGACVVSLVGFLLVFFLCKPESQSRTELA